jgi:hypothetical protein
MAKRWRRVADSGPADAHADGRLFDADAVSGRVVPVGESLVMRGIGAGTFKPAPC